MMLLQFVLSQSTHPSDTAVEGSWSFWELDGMTGNLISEGIGIIATAIIFVWLGGYLGRRIADRSFSFKWRSYRSNLADMVAKTHDDLHRLLSLASLITKLCEREYPDITYEHLSEIRVELAESRNNFTTLQKLISDHHFSLREEDIEVVQKYIAGITQMRSETIECSKLLAFESSLSYLLSHPHEFETQLPKDFFDGTRHDHLRRDGKIAADTLREKYVHKPEHTSIVTLTSQLKS